jgi:hypothetical protein
VILIPTDLPNRLLAFCAADPFRSATVDELVLEDDFFRRPLRPEDLSFVDFDTPVSDATFDALSSLMAQRILLCINDTEEPVLPPSASAEPAWRAFYAAETRKAGSELLEALETHAFGFLEAMENSGPFDNAVERLFGDSMRYWGEQRALLQDADYEEAGLRFLLIQHVPLYESVAATGRRVPSAIGSAFAGAAFAANCNSLERRMRGCGLRTGRHSYWQFYLPGSLAAANLLHRLARSPLSLAQYVGARLALEVERAALCGIFCSPGIDVGISAFISDADRLRALLLDRFGPTAATDLLAGAGRMQALLIRSRQGLGAQIGWVRDLGWAQRAARQISERIERDVPDIDRDTFVEPREMCSTTHVHDEHRLVVIETGHMRFWGNVGMTHDMGPGDMILVPKGRLHGSTVLSESCTYHQPIIPDDWRETVPGGANRDPAAPVARQLLDEGAELG